MHEFDIIQRYFSWNSPTNTVITGIGDDAAVLDIPPNNQLVVSVDTLVSGIHFPENTSPDAIGHKALAVNLSDLAAMGATPAWFTLALTLPEVAPDWLESFSQGLKKLADQHAITLIGGDTTQGPLTISIQVMGLVETKMGQGKALLRSGAKSGDRIYVTGTLGDAAAGLQTIQTSLVLPDKDIIFCQDRLNYPQPRLPESNIIREFASACIDVSDGLLQDLSHILEASGVGAELDLSLLPLSSSLHKLARSQTNKFVQSGGDDYELLFTIPLENEQEFLKQYHAHLDTKISCIGIINDQNGQLIEKSTLKPMKSAGYNHFAN